ncbi:MAG: FAD-dependent oxidoreductase [Bacteroidetes bacterium]|uniref:glycerol-3-phosphate dehydrogenase/oxidase n=1 Tax=Phnomibacter sp. TaxID=2836217 RepID=UPI002FDD7191|nr:FAD-dependent oxidoreductase [Bacteroidota bacterium]
MVFFTMQRANHIDALSGQLFDMVVIGGGATGAGTALDAASRGYKVLLLEKNDFGAATSSKSTKLIHGGVRYLEQAFKKLSVGQYRMVKKALHERTTLLRLAPHITQPLQLITPCRTWLEACYYYVGLKLYDFISGKSHIGKSRWMSQQQALQALPALAAQKMVAAVAYYDGQLDDSRYNLALIQTAQQYGAICINHISVTALQKNETGKITGLHCSDTLTGNSYTLATKVVINATGPFADHIRLMANKQLTPRIRVSKGVHMVLPRTVWPGQSAMLIPKTADGRIIFAIPYKQHLLIGTTDEEDNLTEKAFGPSTKDVQYLLQYLNDYLQHPVTENEVLAGFGGQRPLVQQAGSNSTKDLIRDHEIEIDAPSGLISVLGGKWTTYRLMAKDAVDAAGNMLGTPRACITATLSLVGSQQYNSTTVINQVDFLPDFIVQHLLKTYGDQSIVIIQLARQQPALAALILPGLPYTYAELQYVVSKEMAFTIEDVISRRWGVDLLNWEMAIELAKPVGKWMGEYMQWTTQQEARYTTEYMQQIQLLIQQSRL